MINLSASLLATLLGLLCLALPPCTSAQDMPDNTIFPDQIHIPEQLTPAAGKKIVVAIVDDGVRITHADLRDLIWQNPFEIPGNQVDDDGNGQVDDSNGWDVADNDQDVAPPDSRLPEYFHGTHLAGIVAAIARAAYGSLAPAAIALMPVKSLADQAQDTAIRHGYQGIDYAVRAGADIILCAWGVGHISPDEEQILRRAREKGVLIISAAGNFPEEREQYPAAGPGVLAIGAVDKNRRLSSRSNYGSFVDLSAPGEVIVSAVATSDTAREAHSGTSQAAAMVAGAAAVLLAQNPDSSPERINACLKNGADLIIPEPVAYTAKQGAGLLNVAAALACLQPDALSRTKRIHPQGYLDLAAAGTWPASWSIAPEGPFKGIWFFRPAAGENLLTGTIELYAGDAPAGKPLASFPLAAMPEKFFVPGTRAFVTYRGEGERGKDKELLLEYRAEAILFRSLYCAGAKNLTEPGSLEDGSGDKPYAANSDCKWLITAPPGKVIRFTFTEFDTEPLADLLYFFNGTGTHEKIMGIFSGANIPPELTTWRNQVLVWFVSNGENQGQGWQGKFTFLDEKKANYPTQPARP